MKPIFFTSFLFIAQLLWAQADLPFTNPELQYKIQEDEVDKSFIKYTIHPELNSSKIVKTETEKQGDITIEKSYFANGTLADKKIIRNGKKEGLRILYYEKGRLQQEVPYVADEIHGVKKYYYPNGNLAVETIYNHNKREGNRIIYLREYQDETKKIHAIVPYKNDRIEGVILKYSRRADHYYLKYKASFSNGIPNGKWETFEEHYKPLPKNADGREYSIWETYKAREENNTDGKKNGNDIRFWPDGTIKDITVYENNVKIVTEVYNRIGQKVQINHFVKGKENGLHKYYYDNDVLRIAAFYINGKLQDTLRAYFSDGKMESIKNFDSGKMKGKTIEYWENGNIKQAINYGKFEKKQGTALYYFQDGKMREETEFDENGLMLSDLYFDRYSGKKTNRILYENSLMSLQQYFNKNEKILWTNYFKNGKSFGLQKHFGWNEKVSSQSYMDEDGNGYQYQYNDYGEKIIAEKYFIERKPVAKELFFAEFEIEEDIVIRKN